MRFRTVALTFLVAVLSCSALARDVQQGQVDRLFDQWDNRESPGFAIGVFRDGETVYTRGYGMADLDHGIPNTPETVFFIGSMGKQFTVASVLQLEAEGKLSLDDDVRKHVPELHEFDEPITIRHLIHHTSGLRDFLNLALIAGRIDETFSDVQWLNDKHVLDMVSRQRGLNFPTGTSMMYCNTGYFLMSLICERVGGKKAPEYVVEHLTKPLGMTHTYAVEDARRTIPNRAYGYVGAEGGVRTNAVAYGAPGPAGLWSSVNDLGKWAHAFLTDGIGVPGTVDKMLEKGMLKSGRRIPYAGGVVLGDDRGLRIIEHGGGYPGYMCDMVHYPDYGYSFVCLANAPADPTGKCRQMARIYLGRFMDPEPEKPSAAEAAGADDPSKYDSYAGDYKLDIGQTFTIVSEGGALYLTVKQAPVKFKLEHVSGTKYGNKEIGAEVEFLPDEQGKVDKLKVYQGGGQYDGKRLPKVTLTPEELGEYVGSYTSEELDATYRVMVEGEELKAKMPRGDTVSMQCVGDKSHWVTAGGFPLQIDFTRDESGKVTGFTLSDSGRAAGIECTRE